MVFSPGLTGWEKRRGGGWLVLVLVCSGSPNRSFASCHPGRQGQRQRARGRHFPGFSVLRGYPRSNADVVRAVKKISSDLWTTPISLCLCLFISPTPSLSSIYPSTPQVPST
ncbi:hypothetical protein P170DRAFT_152315 [Aspergillus steynii IBT 23096]|uniref:Uncharacterized protein n=1 Tax=Aspergillus steynii IBT 23096 TaxID=1392250 RepID=A0A2I2GCU9_9EURO|nr:uncharacterized protein P170DRAFT_152315 [Aspergillus steynii IBT 23096]PLB50716.1 hypothetical protein P170DRAFT_152315 [Aspergillus steynii IBT 23096]